MAKSRRQRIKRRRKNANRKKAPLSQEAQRIKALQSQYRTEDSATLLPRLAISCKDEVKQGWILISTIPILCLTGAKYDYELDVLCRPESDERAEKVVARYGFFR